MKPDSPLKKKLLAAKIGRPIKVATHLDRAEAHRIALAAGFNITTRRTVARDGYEIFRTT